MYDNLPHVWLASQRTLGSRLVLGQNYFSATHATRVGRLLYTLLIVVSAAPVDGAAVELCELLAVGAAQQALDFVTGLDGPDSRRSACEDEISFLKEKRKIEVEIKQDTRCLAKSLPLGS